MYALMKAYKGLQRKALMVTVHCIKMSQIWNKILMLCESKSGYIWKSIIDTGKGTILNEKYADYGLEISSVLSLIDPLLDQAYCLTMDNFYNSPELVDILLKRSTDVYGTVRQNRRGMPIAFQKEKLKHGSIAAGQRGKIIALKWRDNKDDCLLSTIHDASTLNVLSKSKQIVSKQKTVVAYSGTTGGVDRAYQAITFYPVVRKQQKKY